MKVCVRCKKNKRPNAVWICKECASKMIDNFEGGLGHTYVYGLISGNGRVQYIGVTNNPVGRASKHFTSKNKKFKTMKIFKIFDSRQGALNYERRAIDILRPRFNTLVLDSKDVPISETEIVEVFGSVQQDRRRTEIIRAVPNKESYE